MDTKIRNPEYLFYMSEPHVERSILERCISLITSKEECVPAKIRVLPQRGSLPFHSARGKVKVMGWGLLGEAGRRRET